jgi:hypothetical protein
MDVLCGEVQSPRYDALHTRTLAFVDEDYWVIHDRLCAPSAHDYTAHWHLDRLAQGRVAVRTDDQQTAVTTPLNTFVVPAGYGDVGLVSGWVSPTYGVKHRAPVVHVSAAGRRDADLVTVVTPGDEVPTVSGLRRQSGLVVEVSRAGRGPVRLHLTPTGAFLERDGGQRS